MNQTQDTTLLEVLAVIPDPHKARGRWYAWPLLLTLMDALLTQRSLAQQIIDQCGHYLMIVKRNQPQLPDDIAMVFDLSAIAADHEHWDRQQTTTKGHGRIERRTLDRTTSDRAALGWSGAAQLLRRASERTVQRIGKCSITVTYGITSLPPAEADARLLEQLWREHWTMESRSHDIRDVTLGEDRDHMHTGHASQALAALRNGLLALWRRDGWTNIAHAVRAHAASVHHALAFIGVPMTLT